MKTFLAIACILIAFVSLNAQTQLTNIPGTPLSSNPSNYLNFNSELYFTAYTSLYGNEIWKTNGTTSGTILLKDINPGAKSTGVSNFVYFMNKMYFVGGDNANGYQFWSSDGTASGTNRISGNLNSQVSKIVVSGDYIYFCKKIGAFLEVWKYNGTANGLFLVKGDIPILNDISNLKSALGLVFFSFNPGGGPDSRVWRTDGTEIGTFPITGLLDGNGSGEGGTTHPTQFIEYNNYLYFIARSGNFFPSVGIVKTDGSVAGTTYVKGIHSGADLIEFSQVGVFNNKMYFSFYDLEKKRYFIWESSGLAENTTKFYDFSSSNYFVPSYFCQTGNNLFFTIGNTSGGTSLMKKSLSTGNEELVKEMAGATPPPFIFTGKYHISQIEVNGTGQIFIQMSNSNYSGTELWVSNGLASGTLKLCSAGYEPLNVIGDHTIFTGHMPNGDYELWSSDGTVAGSKLIMDIEPAQETYFGDIIQLSHNVLFNASTQEQGFELWSSDGSIAGTKFLKDIFAGQNSSYPQSFTTSGDEVFFAASIGQGKAEVFATDGTALGTRPVTALYDAGMSLHSFKHLDNGTYLIVAGKTDGTYSIIKFIPGQPLLELKNLGKNQYGVGFSPTETVSIGNVMYMLVGGVGVQLWKCDGTPEGTVKVKDFYEAYKLTATSNKIYLLANRTDHINMDLWSSDGTESGTVALKAFSYQEIILYPLLDKLLFAAPEPGVGKELWITDGTAANTSLLKDIYEGPGNGVSEPYFTHHNGSVFFSAATLAAGVELWKTDGTEIGTVLVKDILPGAESSFPARLASTGGRLYFSAYTLQNGVEPWSSDGSTADTKLEYDVVPGVEHSNPRQFVRAGDNLFFIAYAGTSGYQLFNGNYLEDNTDDEDGDDEPEVPTATESEISSKVAVYPNPSTDILTIRAPDDMKGTLISLHDTTGRLLLSQSIKDSESQFSMTSFSPGLYLLRFQKGNTMVVKKVIKK